MSDVRYCERCRWRTVHKKGACQDCAAPANEVPDKTLEECGQQVIPLFPESQVVS